MAFKRVGNLLVEATIWVLWAWVAGAGTLFLLVGVFAHFEVLDTQSPDWIVAIGTVSGLFASIFIASNQSRQQARTQRQRELVLIAAVSHRGREAAAALYGLNIALATYYRPITSETPRDVLGKVEALDVEIGLLKRVELANLPDPQAVDDLVRLIAILEVARDEAVAGRVLDRELKENGPIYPLDVYWRMAKERLEALKR